MTSSIILLRASAVRNLSRLLNDFDIRDDESIRSVTHRLDEQLDFVMITERLTLFLSYDRNLIMYE